MYEETFKGHHAILNMVNREQFRIVTLKIVRKTFGKIHNYRTTDKLEVFFFFNVLSAGLYKLVGSPL